MTETNNECAKYTMELRVLSFLLQNYDIPPRRSDPLTSRRLACPRVVRGRLNASAHRNMGVQSAPQARFRATLGWAARPSA